MKVLGLMGGIGCGKSLIANYLRTLFKMKVFDADQVVHELYKSNHNLIEQAKFFFPEVVIDSKIDRTLLAKRFFAADKNWNKFEHAVHKIVYQRANFFLKWARRNIINYAVLDIPLLIEGGYLKYCDTIALIVTNKKEQERRLKARGLNAEQINYIRRKQSSILERKKLANFEVNNGLSKAQTLSQLKKLIVKINC